MKKNVFKIIKRLFVVVALGLLTGLIFYYLHTLLIEDKFFWREKWDFAERTLYVTFALLVGTIYKYLYDALKRIPSKVFVSLGLSAVFTVCVFFANNYFHYLEWNSVIFNWRYHFPYSQFLEYDITYTYGYGEYRYILIFLAMCAANLAIVAYFKWVTPVMKKWIQDIGRWYFGPNEKTIENKIQRLLTGADYTDFILEINCMPQNEETKNLFKKLINKYDEECKLVELYQGLFIRFWEYLSREEYLEYRQRYLENFDEPLPEKCGALDKLFEYDASIDDSAKSTTE